ncbi:phosphoribosylanthranilate isomerase [Belliella sp. DSM 111904]|uniref:N-(5'-phosphoribosyl)anthranilate isomerase n=1 Tax=Belliella filtrata TaxID=2923435 RepID=A0ABS9UYQ0_9BACT|nr:phosphoribosylanthranilate isomerase [Belliella filtrata]MCH7409289.1 phosphoribosylanthranilate isomerase [Belliella filtrata]
MRNLTNIQELVAKVNPDWMGLIFFPKSTRYVPQDFSIRISQVPISKVGVFVNSTLEEIKYKINSFGLSTVQLHGGESVDFVKAVKEETGVEVFKVFSVKEQLEWNTIQPYLPFVDYLLFDTFTAAHGGSGKTFDWELLKRYPFTKPFLLSGGLDITHADQLIELHDQIPYLKGLDVNSKFELSPALKDVTKVSELKSILTN